MQDLLLRYKYFAEDALRESTWFFPTLNDLYIFIMTVIFITLIGIGFYKLILRNKKYEYLNRLFIKLIDAVL